MSRIRPINDPKSRCTEPKKKGISKVAIIALFIFIALVFVMGVIGIGSVIMDVLISKSNSAEFGENQTGLSAQISFGLSKYAAHGELSCGLMWVEETKSSY